MFIGRVWNYECSMDLMVVQRRLGFFEASFMRSRLAVANDLVINLFADGACSPIGKAVRFGIGSLPSPLEPASLFPSVNGLR